MSNQEGLIELPPLQQDKVKEAKESLLKENPIYLFHEHFSCFDHDHAPSPTQKSQYQQPSELWEADTYRYEFNATMFFKSLVVFLLDISGLGFPIIAVWMTFCSKFLYNLHFIGKLNDSFLIFGCMNIMLLIYKAYHGNFVFTDATSLHYLTELVFLAIMGASCSCYLNNKVLPLLKTVELSKESQKLVSIYSLEDFGGIAEFKRTILRLNIDASSFFMTFLETDGLGELYRRKPDPNLSPSIKEEEHKLILDKQISKADFLAESAQFEVAVFDYKFLTKSTHYDEKKAYGLRYAERVLESYRLRFIFSRLLLFAGCFAIVSLSFMNLGSNTDRSEGFVEKYLIKGCMLLFNLNNISCILTLMLNGAMVLWIRLDFLKGLTELISEEKFAEDSIFRQQCSMLNIFDPESLRTWAALRMAFMNMNSWKLDAATLGTSLIVAIQLIGLSVLGFFYFSAEQQEQKDFFLQYIIFFGILALVHMTFVLIFIFSGSQVNNQYQEHIYQLKKLKMTIFKLFAMYPTLDGEDGVQPSTYLYARGLRYLRQSFEGQEITKEALDEKLQKINEAYEEIIEELETEELYSPLKLLGIPMTDSFVNTVLGTIITIIMIPASSYLADLTGWG